MWGPTPRPMCAMAKRPRWHCVWC